MVITHRTLVLQRMSMYFNQPPPPTQPLIKKVKRVLFLRHGQAMHNPRAEKAKADGCSYETFLKLMEEDDQFDAELTKIGIQQAMDGREKNASILNDVDLVVSSPLSRTLKTADLTICPKDGIPSDDNIDGGGSMVSNSNNGNVVSSSSSSNTNIIYPKRICIEEWREIKGWLLNAKRRRKSELQKMFHHTWNFDSLSEEDETWTDKLEKYQDCSERGYQALLWLLRRNEDKILVVCHGGILKFCMNDHPLVTVIDSRKEGDKVFKNCEMREYNMSHDTNGNGGTDQRPVVFLTEIMENNKI